MKLPASLCLCALVVLSLGVSSCVVIGWPPLPAVTYRGLVVDQRSRPVAGAEVTLHRPGRFVAESPIGISTEFPSEEIAKTYTGRDGRFAVSTRSGYATAALAVVGDHAAAGYVGTADEAGDPALPRELLIKVR